MPNCLAGLKTLRCEVKNLTRDEAIVYMVESNFQRSEILPSEKAFAYKMRLEALNRQGQRTDLTSRPVGKKLSVTELSEESGDSERQVHRYIRLTHLIPELLELVDEGKIKMRPAVEISYLDEDFQKSLFEEIEINQATPSHAQAIRMRRSQNEGTLTALEIRDIMAEEKPNQRERIVLSADRVRKLIPKNIPLNKTEDFICKAIEYYGRHLRQRSERGDR